MPVLSSVMHVLAKFFVFKSFLVITCAIVDESRIRLQFFFCVEI